MLKGVTKAFTFTLSKKAKILVFGLKSVPVKLIVRERNIGIRTLLITRNP